ncbi:hypothetical protein RFI_36458, partial [Reticulomyxa filosa]
MHQQVNESLQAYITESWEQQSKHGYKKEVEEGNASNENDELWYQLCNFFANKIIQTFNPHVYADKGSTPRIHPEFLLRGLHQNFTLVFNQAGVLFDQVHEIESALMNTFGYPVNTNVYVSGSAKERKERQLAPKDKKNKNKKRNEEEEEDERIVMPEEEEEGELSKEDKLLSTRIHTDRQDVFVFQAHGVKRWTLWKPKVKLPGFRQIRGKNEDRNFNPEEHLPSKVPYMDVLLYPGDILYVPRGWPHQNTLIRTYVNQQSIHYTLGIFFKKIKKELKSCDIIS